MGKDGEIIEIHGGFVQEHHPAGKISIEQNHGGFSRIRS